MTSDELLEDYLDLEQADIWACLAFTSKDSSFFYPQ